MARNVPGSGACGLIISQDTRNKLDDLKVKRSELELDVLRHQLDTLKAKENSLDLLEVLHDPGFAGGVT